MNRTARRAWKKLTADEQMQIKAHYNALALYAAEIYLEDLDLSNLMNLHDNYGWGIKRLRDFYGHACQTHLRLEERFSLENETHTLYRQWADEMGINLDDWTTEEVQKWERSREQNTMTASLS